VVAKGRGLKPVDCHDLYRDGRHYDSHVSDFVDDIDFYFRQIKRYGQPVLELACGTGRVTIPLAEREIEVSGLDVSDSMLSHAKEKTRQKGLKINWIRGDCRTFSIKKKFRFIFLPYNSITHIHDRESIQGLFGSVRKHLFRDGRFVIDVFNPRLDILMRSPDELYHVAKYPDPDGRGMVEIGERHNYDAASQINHIKWYYNIGDGKEEFVIENNMRIYFPQELDELLHYNGFQIEHKYGDYDESAFQATSPKQIMVCKKK
jgi:SAM-dependent methyltransferase